MTTNAPHFYNPCSEPHKNNDNGDKENTPLTQNSSVKKRPVQVQTLAVHNDNGKNDKVTLQIFRNKDKCMVTVQHHDT